MLAAQKKLIQQRAFYGAGSIVWNALRPVNSKLYMQNTASRKARTWQAALGRVVERAVSRGMRLCSALHKFDNLTHLF